MENPKNEEHRSCGSDAEAVAVKTIIRLINLSFEGRNLSGLDYIIPPQTLTEADNMRLNERRIMSICELGKCLDAAAPVPVHDRTGILMHSRLKLQLLEARSG